MSAYKRLKDIFGELVEAYENGDEQAIDLLTKQIKNSGKSLRLQVDDDLQWEESQVKGYEECPMVVQSITVFLGEEAVCEVERWFGSEMIDPTHTGLGGRWETICVDEGSHKGLIELLEDFGHCIDVPDVPEWR